jgi:hypothetical protein
VSLALGACGEDAKPESPASASVGSVSETPAPTASAEAPVDRSLLKAKVDAETKTLDVVAYIADERDGPMFMGAQAATNFRLFPFEQTMVVSRAGQLFELQGDKLVLNTKAVTTEKVPGNTPVLGAYEIQRLEGDYPESLFVTAEFQSFMGPRQGSYRTVYYVRTGGAWKTRESPPTSVAAWKNGAMLGLTLGKPVVESGPPTTLPAQTPGTEGKCLPGASLVFGRKLAGRPTGELILLGARCDTNRPVIERWSAEGKGTLEDLPGAPKELSPLHFHDHLRMTSSTSGVVAISGPDHTPYVARFDGGGFRPVDIPDKGDIDEAWMTADGAIFLVLIDSVSKAPNMLVRSLPDGQYTRWKAPRGYGMRGLWARDRDTAYVGWSAFGSSEAVLFGTKPALLTSQGAPPSFTAPRPEKPSAPRGEAPVDGVAAFPKYDDACKDPFVFLYDVAVQTPPGFPFPLTVKTLHAFTKKEGLELVDFKHGGKRRLGVRVPNKEVAAELVKHVKGLMPEDNPELVCFKAPADARNVAVPQ